MDCTDMKHLDLFHIVFAECQMLGFDSNGSIHISNFQDVKHTEWFYRMLVHMGILEFGHHGGP